MTQPESQSPNESAQPQKPTQDGSKQGGRGPRRGKRSGRGRKPKSGQSSRSPRKQVDTPLDHMRRSFFGCPRCSFFYSNVRALIGVEQLKVSAETMTDGQLTLAWQHEMRDIVERHYGFDIHSDTVYFEGSCMECGRAFVFDSEPGESFKELTIQAARYVGPLR